MTLQDIFTMVDGLPGNYMVFEAAPSGLHFLHHTCNMAALTAMTAQETRALTSPYDVVLEDDREMIRKAMGEYLQSGGEQQMELLFRMIHRVRGFIWVHLLVKRYAEVEGKQLYLANLVDATKETMISYALMDASDRYICVIEKATKRILYGNDKFYDLIDATPAQAVGKYCYELLCKVLEMRDNDNCLCYSSLNADPPIETYNPLKKLYLTITGREVVWGEYDAYVFYMTDITEKKQREAELEDSQKRFEVALENSELMVWEYDMVNNLCITSRKAGSDYNIPLVIENYPESLYDMGHTPPETVAQIKEVKQRLLRGETGFSVERRTVDKTGKSQWQKVEYTLEKDAAGRPVRAIVCGLDITAQKELEAKYEEQVEYRNKLAQNAMFSARMDLDGNLLGDYTSTDARLSALADKATDAASFLTGFFTYADFSETQELTRDKLTRETLTETFALGQSQYHAVYRCRLLNLYLELNLTMYRNPGSGHLELFFVITDANTAVLMQNAFQRVVTTDYDFVAVIDPVTGKMTILAHAEGAHLPPHDEDGASGDYDSAVMAFANSYRSFYHTEEDFRAASEGMLLETVIEKLNAQQSYEFTCKTRARSGDIHTYRLSFAYADAGRDQIVCTRSNITQVVLAEQRSQQLLEKALDAARVANQAKTDFLARMSHDMRTPMNAIIGLSALTLDDAEDPAAVRDNMTKMRASSDFLLGLVNDILDMAKIEDGSVVLKPEPYTYFEFLSNMRTMFQPQCEAKGIHLTFKQPKINPMIRVDKMRVNQIFFNIFSNAVKYTPAGGSIDYTIENLKFFGDKLSVDYLVRDTGIGMSEEYQKHLFEPFMQEHSEVTAELQGSGLGLSITKQLVDLMGGTIRITSRQGEGTTVRVSFTFECLSQDAKELPQPKLPQGDEDCLVGKRVLLVEDHPLNAQIARRLLERKGMTVAYAANGRVAVEQVASAPLGFFDVILMDIRMPEMSGLEAARAIRALPREDAKTVPIYAMSANAYAEDVQKSLDAGMNGHLAKPVEPQVLFQALTACFAKQAE